MKKALLSTAFLLMLPFTIVAMSSTPASAASDTTAPAAVEAEALDCGADDAVAGKKVYKKCAACHVVNKEKNKVGPHLVGLFGRKAGSIEGYRYSKAFKKANADGLVWNAKTLDEFLTKPKKMIPKTKMPFRGIKKENQRNALLCYIQSVNG